MIQDEKLTIEVQCDSLAEMSDPPTTWAEAVEAMLADAVDYDDLHALCQQAASFADMVDRVEDEPAEPWGIWQFSAEAMADALVEQQADEGRDGEVNIRLARLFRYMALTADIGASVYLDGGGRLSRQLSFVEESHA